MRRAAGLAAAALLALVARIEPRLRCT